MLTQRVFVWIIYIFEFHWRSVQQDASVFKKKKSSAVVKCNGNEVQTFLDTVVLNNALLYEHGFKWIMHIAIFNSLREIA